MGKYLETQKGGRNGPDWILEMGPKSGGKNRRFWLGRFLALLLRLRFAIAEPVGAELDGARFGQTAQS